MSDFEIAEKHFNNQNYPLAFELFFQIATSDNTDKVTRADCFNMLGVIVSGFSPDLGIDETGLEYFRKALELDPYNLGALWNIFDGYGASPSQHKDVALMEQARHRLLSLLEGKLSESEITRLKKTF